MYELKDVTDYEFVNAILHKFELDLDSITRVAIITETVRGEYAIAGYRFYECDEYFGAIFFENSSSDKYHRFWALFDENGDLVYHENGYIKSFSFSTHSHEDSVDELSNIIENEATVFKFDNDTGRFSIYTRTKHGIELLGEIKNFPTDVRLRWNVIPVSEERRNKFFTRTETIADKLPVKELLTLSYDKQEFLDVKRNEDIDSFPGPEESIFATESWAHKRYLSEYHKLTEKLYRDESFRYATKFTLKPETKVLYLKTAGDLELLAALYPEDHIDIATLWLNGDAMFFVDWDKVRKDYDAVYVNQRDTIHWKVPGIIVLNFTAIDKYNSFSLDLYKKKHGLDY